MSVYSCTYIHQVQKEGLHIASFVNTVEPCHTAAPEKRPSTILQTLCLVSDVFICIIKTPEMWKPLYSVKWTGFPVPTVPELFKFTWLSGHLSTAFVKLCTAFSGFKGRALYSLIMLPFSILYGNGKFRKHGLIVLTSSSTHYHTHWKYAGKT